MTLSGDDQAEPGKPASETGDQSTSNNSKPEKENWGYDLYPERKGAKYKASWFGTLVGIEGREALDKAKCEHRVYACMKDNPLIKLMVAALNSSGCPFDIRRHVSCEVCDTKVSGGYDPELNQVVICQNTVRQQAMVGSVMVHEMIHMFDWCRNEMDFKNIDHLACTEIRAANLTHCSFLSAWSMGVASPFNVRRMHQECVKQKALTSVVTARNVTVEEGRAAIERVFPMCYPDLEPIGRRIKRNSTDMFRAYSEGPLYGYDT